MATCGVALWETTLPLSCGAGGIIASVKSAFFGLGITGACPAVQAPPAGSCTAPPDAVMAYVVKACVGRSACSLKSGNATWAALFSGNGTSPGSRRLAALGASKSRAEEGSVDYGNVCCGGAAAGASAGARRLSAMGSLKSRADAPTSFNGMCGAAAASKASNSSAGARRLTALASLKSRSAAPPAAGMNGNSLLSMPRLAVTITCQ